MAASLNFFASQFKCVVCSEMSRVPAQSPFECPHCRSVYTASMKLALNSGIGAAGATVTLGTAFGMRTVVAAILALVLAFVIWRSLFEVKLVRRGRSTV